MRTELSNYERDHPASASRGNVSAWFERASLYFFRRRVRRLGVGSPAWHIIQEKLSHGSSVGIDQQKRNIFLSETLPECGKNLFVHPLVTFYYPENIRIGVNVFINRGSMFVAPARVTIGNNVMVGPYCMFNSGSHKYESRAKSIDEQGHKYGEITVDDGAWVGGHVCVLPGVTLGKGCVVGAGAVVTHSVPPYAVVAGVPAHIIGTRDGH